MHAGWELERTQSLRKLVAIGKRYGVGEILSENIVVFIDKVYRGWDPVEEGLLPTGELTREETESIVQAVSAAPKRLLQTH